MFKAKNIIGLDIGTSSIKLAEVKKDKEGMHLVRASFIELSMDERNDIVPSVLRILKSEKIPFAKAIISISGRSVFNRFIKLPKLAEQKINQIMKFEAQQQIPFPIEEVVWNYYLLKKTEAEEGQIDVALVAVKKDLIEHLVEELYDTNLYIQTVDVAPYALYSAIDYNNGLENVVILDIGAKTTNIIISKEGRVWTRNVPVAGDDITKAIAEGLDISFEAAERRKKEEGIVLVEAEEVPKEHISNFITQALNDLLTEISRSIGYYKSQFGDVSFSGILLTGGTSKLKNIDKFFEKNLKLKTSFCDFFKEIKPRSDLKSDLSQCAPLIGVAVGLALRSVIEPAISINLIPQQLLKQKELGRKKKYIFGSMVLAIASMLLLNSQVVIKNKEVKKQIEETGKVLANYRDFEKKIAFIKGELEPIEKRLGLFDRLIIERQFWLEMFSEIAGVLEKDSWLTDISFGDSKTILIKGKTNSFLMVTQIKEGFEKSTFFENVETLSANLDKDEEEQRISFIFRAGLEKKGLMFR